MGAALGQAFLTAACDQWVQQLHHSPCLVLHTALPGECKAKVQREHLRHWPWVGPHPSHCTDCWGHLLTKVCVQSNPGLQAGRTGTWCGAEPWPQGCFRGDCSAPTLLWPWTDCCCLFLLSWGKSHLGEWENNSSMRTCSSWAFQTKSNPEGVAQHPETTTLRKRVSRSSIDFHRSPEL